MCTRMCGFMMFFCAVTILSAQTGPTEHNATSGVSGAGKGSLREPNEDRLVRALGIECEARPEGIVITEVYVTMPAYAAGLCSGDILLAIDQQPVTTSQQAIERSRNIRAASVMVDLLRRDMRISRRVEVADGIRPMLGVARNDEAVALSFRRLNASALRELSKVGLRLERNSPQCIVVDLRSMTGDSGSGGSWQEIQQVLRNIMESAPDMKMIVLRADVLEGPAKDLVSGLMATSGAIVRNARSAAFIRRDVGQFNRPGGVPMIAAMSAHGMPKLTVAPVQWSISDFRSRYPIPDRAAMQHPIMSEHTGMAPVVWGLNGSAWEALAMAGPMI